METMPAMLNKLPRRALFGATGALSANLAYFCDISAAALSGH
jgi:hypothetical protein